VACGNAKVIAFGSCMAGSAGHIRFLLAGVVNSPRNDSSMSGRDVNDPSADDPSRFDRILSYPA